jgi:hypothetical protein
MKIAYLVLAHDNFKNLEKLISTLNDKNVKFFVHIDKKSKMPEHFLQGENIIFVNRTSVYWGGLSQVLAIINLILEAVKNNCSYYVLISGTDYPIRPNSFLYQKLSDGGEFINILKGFQTHKPASKINFYHFDNYNRRDRYSIKRIAFRFTEKCLNLLLDLKIIKKPPYPFKEIFFGSEWWALSHEAVSYILQFINNNPSYMKFYKFTLCPDESFFQTILGNSEFLKNCKPNLTYTDWSSTPAPAIIGPKHLLLFKNQVEFDTYAGKQTPFFARKFNDDSHDLVLQIEKELRG